MSLQTLIASLKPAVNPDCIDSNSNTIYEETPSTVEFTDILIVKVLSKTKFPVFIVQSNVNQKKYAMKAFPFSSSNKSHACFRNESRFSFVDYPNIIKTHHVESERETITKGVTKKVSYTIMEFASHEDFHSFTLDKGEHTNDMMIRTYFRQLIDGLEYLHNNSISHMDLKLENLLLCDNFSLKIADFDLSYIKNDAKVLGRGTKFYRGPEVVQNKCVNTQAADIYSAGIILFSLFTKGVLPHAEGARVGGVDFAALLYCKNDEFWSEHIKVQKKDIFDQHFIDLFNAMI